MAICKKVSGPDDVMTFLRRENLRQAAKPSDELATVLATNGTQVIALALRLSKNGSLSGAKVHRICKITKLLRDFSPFVLLSHDFMLSLHT